MPRKPQVRSRRLNRGEASDSAAGASGSTPRGSTPVRRSEPAVFWQCQSCGAPVEPQFGAGDDSWCPSCQAVGTIAGMEGQYPSPRLYGAWAARKAHQREHERTQAELTKSLHRPRTQKEEIMKRTKTHSGTFHCPACFIEVELINEESLKCDRCKGPLAEGSLEEVWADDEQDEED